MPEVHPPADSIDACDVQAWVDQLYGNNKPSGVVDDLIARRREDARREDAEFAVAPEARLGIDDDSVSNEGNEAMSVQLVIELPSRHGTQTIVQALEVYKARLRSSIERTRRRLTAFEQRYGVPTDKFLSSMTAEDLSGGDLEYVEWAGEAELLEGLESELDELDHARYQLP